MKCVPSSRLKVCILLLYILAPLVARAQMDSLLFITTDRVDSTARGELRLNVDNISFFRDNEYKSDLVKGYTLPGIWITPTLSYQPLRNLKVDVGLQMLHYWGANVYPNFNYSHITSWKGDQIQKGFHAVPIFRAHLQLTPTFGVVVGTLVGKQNHGLIAPLYNDELSLSSDPETGVQLLWKTQAFSLDTWINWESFIYRKDTHQESFAFGFSSRIMPSRQKARTKVYIPVQTLFQHRGGEINTAASERSIKTWMNAATGLGITIPLTTHIPVRLNAEADMAFYSQQAGTALPFSKGYGLLMKTAAQVWRCNVSASYWRCHDFVSILGNPLYGAISLDEKGLTLTDPQTVCFRAEYAQGLGRGFSWGVHTDLFYQPKCTAVQAGMGEFTSSSSLNFAAGIYIRIHPSFLLKRFRY